MTSEEIEQVKQDGAKVRAKRKSYGFKRGEVAKRLGFTEAWVTHNEAPGKWSGQKAATVRRNQQKIMKEVEKMAEVEKIKKPIGSVITSKTKTDLLIAKKADEKEQAEQGNPKLQYARVVSELRQIEADTKKANQRLAEIDGGIAHPEMDGGISFLISKKRKLARERQGILEDLEVLRAPVEFLKARKTRLDAILKKQEEYLARQRQLRVISEGRLLVKRATQMANAMLKEAMSFSAALDDFYPDHDAQNEVSDTALKDVEPAELLK